MDKRDQQWSEAPSIHDSVADGRTHDIEGAWKNNAERGSRHSKLSRHTSANDPLFAALSKERVLVFVVGPSRDQAPLRDIGDKAGRLSRLCQKR